jgi:fructose-1,6-bisphosphatase I
MASTAVPKETLTRQDGHTMDKATRLRAEQVTLTQWITRFTAGDHDLTILMNAIQHAGKVTANAIAKSSAQGNVGLTGETNFTGDDVKVLDLLSNDIFITALSGSGVCGVLVSEEDPEPIYPPQVGGRPGKFCVAFDPLDGSSNIDCNVSVGSIFGVYERSSIGAVEPSQNDILRPGKDLVVAGYIMYGAACELVITIRGQGVERFALDPAIQEFMHIGGIQLPADGGKKIYSCNEGNSVHWDSQIKEFVEHCKGSGYAARYVGSMVADIHRTLLYGGIFLYPADKKSTKGKLRLLYEGFPMAMITENAGGIATAGMFNGAVRRVLDLIPEGIHDKCPIIMGVPRDVEDVRGRYAA